MGSFAASEAEPDVEADAPVDSETFAEPETPASVSESRPKAIFTKPLTDCSSDSPFALDAPSSASSSDLALSPIRADSLEPSALSLAKEDSAEAEDSTVPSYKITPYPDMLPAMSSMPVEA